MKTRSIVAVLLLIGSAVFAAEPVRVACVGDSITYGAAVADREVNCYPAVLQGLLGEAYRVQNFGVNGATMLKKGNKPYWQQKAYADARDFAPQIVFIKLGTNDSKLANWKHKGDFVANYKEMIAAFRALPSKPRVILLAPIPAFMDGEKISASRVLKEVTPAVRTVAYDTECELIDLYQVFINRADEVPDKIHPNAAGAKRLATRLADYLKQPSEDLDVMAKLPEGSTFKFHGYAGRRFKKDGVSCQVVAPRHVAPGAPWIWRARFFGHQPQLDIAMLERGWHLVYCEVSDLFGSPTAVKRWDVCYDLMQTAGLNKKPALEGMSRGGLIIWNWAKANPDKVRCIYGDNPVCDIRSWPAGQGEGKHHGPTWEKCKKVWGLSTDEEVKAFAGNPIDGLEPLAKAGVPAFHLCGTADDVVPAKENTDILAERYRALGGKIEVVYKEGQGHHPHCLPNPEPLITFILNAGN